jgi:hypothetical protein
MIIRNFSMLVEGQTAKETPENSQYMLKPDDGGKFQARFPVQPDNSQ